MKKLQEKIIYAHQNLVRFFHLPDTRRYWMIKYGQSWFDWLWNNRDNELFKETWKKEFRFSLETFYFLVDLVQDKIEKCDMSFRKVVPLEKWVAVTLWWLATGNSYRTTSKVFGIGLSTVAKVIYEFCEAMLEISHEFINFSSNGRETAIAIQKCCAFTESKIPQVVGVNDDAHIEILCVL